MYDPLSNTLIIFGGQSSVGSAFNYNDVWVLSHANGLGGDPTWTQLNPTGLAPIPRAYHTMVYDPNSNRLIVFGGYDGDQDSRLNDTWVLTHANGQGGLPEWVKQTPGETPTLGSSTTAGYARSSNRLIAALGVSMSESVVNDTWVLTNASGNCTANQPCDYDVEASDADAGDVLSYALVQGPEGMTIEAGTGQLHWTPGTAQTGTHGVTVKVTDAGGLSATQGFQLTVSPVAVPNVQGLAPEWAEAMLQAAGLNTGAKSSLGGAITLNFDTLPSEQGWTFEGGPGIPEESKLFSVNGGVLLQETLGIGGRYTGYKIFSGVNARLPLSISTRTRVTAEEGGISNNHGGFAFYAWPGNSFFGVGLGTGVAWIEGSPTYGDATFDNTTFHDYLFSARPGIGSELMVDGSLLISRSPRVYPNPQYALYLGDITEGPNARAEIAAYSFTQPQIATQTPAPGTLVNPASTVDLGIQEGPATQTVPAVSGLAQTDAESDIVAAGLLAGNITT